MSDTRVLVTSAGSAPACAVIKALRRAPGLDVRVGAVDMAARAVGFCLADWTARVPGANDPEYVAALEELTAREGVEYVFPIIDEELPVWAAHVDRFAARGVHVFSNPLPCVQIANDKRRTAEHCRTHGIAHPRTLTAAEALDAPASVYPLFVKPVGGRGSLGTAIVEHRDDLVRHLHRHPDAVAQELLRGVEYTVDVVTDPHGTIVAMVPKERLEVKSGMATKSVTRNVPVIAEFVARVVDAFGVRGAANVQVMQTDAGPVLIEVNPKFATSLPLTVAAGVNVPALLIGLARGTVPPTPRRSFQADLMLLRCWDDYFVDAS